MKRNFKVIYFITFLILYLEIMFKVFVLKNITVINFLYTFLLSVPIILGFTILCSIFKEKASRIILILSSIIMILWFLVQVIFFKVFSIPFSFATLGLASGAMSFTNVVVLDVLKKVNALKSYVLDILIFAIPLIIYPFIRKHIVFEKYDWKKALKVAGALILAFVISLGIINLDRKGAYSAYNLYYKMDAQVKNMQKLGVLTATRLDLKKLIGKFDDSIIPQTKIERPKEQEEYGYNKMEINFQRLKQNEKNKKIIDLYNYIENIEPSKKNEYTGYFKGKNLIFILAESFNGVVVDKDLTPTLYKLVHSGFVFDNFYTPLFLSTAGGEFQSSTGLLPSQIELKIWREEKPTIAFALGNSFSKVGYTANAYHNWTYSYYQRQKTMESLGFNSYMGIGNGLEKLMNGDWIPSDIDLMNTTTDFYTGEDKFVTFYITMSGHSPYVLAPGHPIAYKNKDLVANLECSQTMKAYIATQIELDRALETLINKLEVAGKLDDTVIALVGDHYPYMISVKEINTISDYKRDDIIEINRSNFILWNNKMEKPIIIDKVGSQIDVLPTLLNLFGIEYDSRMLVGQDILSDKEGLAIFSNRSWKSDLGTFFSRTGKFEAKENKEIPQGYVEEKNREIANKFTMSNLFMKHNIYKKVFGE